ncbi:MAG: hypothetical protein H0W02_06570, partial [Ktedonobacteraceae bacterium]|nr:hypothetical protein [Ktedonobacteraceae bacterium]
NEADQQTINRLQQARATCREMRQRCIRWSSEAFLRAVQPHIQASHATQVLLKHPTYSRLYRLYLRFQQHLKVTYDPETPINELALRRVSELYEMWAVFALTRMAIEVLEEAGYRMISNTTFYEVNRDYFQFQVQKNTPSIIMARGDLRIEFKYEPIYPNQSTSRYRSALVATSMGSNPLTPDLAIETYRGEKPQDILIFDPKYRRDHWHQPPEDAINRMYRYYNSIQYQSYLPERTRDPHLLKKIVSCAYILYPGERIYTEEKHIGALPLKPGMTDEQLAEVREQVKDLLYAAYVIDE